MAQISPSPVAPVSCSFAWGPHQPPQPWLHQTPCFPTPTVRRPLPAFALMQTLSSPTPFPTLAGSICASCLHTQCTPHQVACRSTLFPLLPAVSTSYLHLFHQASSLAGHTLPAPHIACPLNQHPLLLLLLSRRCCPIIDVHGIVRDIVPVFLGMGIHLVFFQHPTPGCLPHLPHLLHFPCFLCFLLNLMLCLFPCLLRLLHLLFVHPLCRLLQQPLGPCPSQHLPLPHQLLSSFLLHYQEFIFDARGLFCRG